MNKNLLFMKSQKNCSKNGSYVQKLKYDKGNKVIIGQTHSNILQPIIANMTENTSVKTTTEILPKSSGPVKRVATATPKKTWPEAIQTLDQYFVFSALKVLTISTTVTRLKNLVNNITFDWLIINTTQVSQAQ